MTPPLLMALALAAVVEQEQGQALPTAAPYPNQHSSKSNPSSNSRKAA
jgi:hypothetical protein